MPKSVQRCDAAGMSLAKMFGVVAIGMPLTLLSTAQVAFMVRKYVQTEMLDAPTADALPPFGRMHFITWGDFPEVPPFVDKCSVHNARFVVLGDWC